MREMIRREGFNLQPVDCDASTAQHVIMIVWHVPDADVPTDPNDIPDDSHFEHAMKRLDGKWSSKNGQDGQHNDIGDTGGFLDRHYPVPEGKTRVIRCFAKP